MPRTHRITQLELDTALLAEDLRQAELFRHNETYDEFAIGTWRHCTLWNRTGDLRDSVLETFAGGGVPTEYEQHLPYVSGLVRERFVIERLKFGKFIILGPGSVLVPHRDYLELDSSFVRIHVPLQTDENCFSSQEDTVYQMRLGEVWFLDASQTHSAASFSGSPRIHLILDFEAGELQDCLRWPVPAETEQAIPESHIVRRREPRRGEREAFLALSGVVDEVNYRDVMAMIIKRFYVARIPVRETFAWLRDIIAASGHEKLLATVTAAEEEFLVRR
ncbi:aspartyl/asparaginyl beta-hydroxylase domain-containing protein [Streptomyces boncukensis]|uniref:L-proline cis-4-hydroxylase n=1 Tax=Streptomyces boncukensis TaxID=2711219 RepID=A0A6G4WV84_9ACTN|nr:aspartyl/asparaginyl beta-hydroxylase domain-containing protein [Streptomyces boncukensis]NGO68762.1 hypothetical protein [Streptomyces boncukensis]